jgi:hypothetical protein
MLAVEFTEDLPHALRTALAFGYAFELFGDGLRSLLVDLACGATMLAPRRVTESGDPIFAGRLSDYGGHRTYSICGIRILITLFISIA